MSLGARTPVHPRAGKHPDSGKLPRGFLTLEGETLHVTSSDAFQSGCFGNVTWKLMKGCQLFLRSGKSLWDKARSVSSAAHCTTSSDIEKRLF